MKILGFTETETEEKKFSCDNCGCRFIANNKEYKQASQIEMLSRIYYTCKCPNCGDTVYK